MKKRHSTVKVVLITLLVFLLLTWILPAAYFSSEYVEQGRIQMGLFDIFSYPITAISYFGYIAIFLLVVGGFYGILGKIGAYRNLLDKLVASFKGKEKLVVSIIMVLLGVITSFCGLQIGLFIFFPFIISLILLMGYDKIVATLTVVGSTMIGIAGTTFGYSNISVILTTLSIKITANIWFKVAILVLGLALLIFNTVPYMSVLEKKNKEEKKRVSKIKKEESKTTTKEKTTKKKVKKKESEKKEKTEKKVKETEKVEKEKESKTKVEKDEGEKVKQLAKKK